jgi:hypothetical protein
MRGMDDDKERRKQIDRLYRCHATPAGWAIESWPGF